MARKLPVEYVQTRKNYILFKNDCGVTDMTRRGGIYEHYIHDYIRDNVYTNNKNIIDIGANFGFHTLEFADVVGEGMVYAFEPQRVVYYQLCANALLNGYSNITAYNIALGDHSNFLQMENPDYFNEDTINIGNAHLNAYTQKYNIVEVRTLDSYKFSNVAVIKIDVQGYEPFVLDGAKETIRNNRPVIFIEVEEPQLNIYGFTGNDIFKRLTAMGYTFEKVINADHLVDYVAKPIN